MSFGWSVGDLLAALTVLNKIRVALKDSGGASSNYQEETGFLQSLSTTLETVNTLQSVPFQGDKFDSLHHTCQQIQGPLNVFLDKVNRDFENKLGPQFVARNQFSKVFRAPRMMQWAVHTSKKVQQLKSSIVVPLLALQIGMSQQIIHLTLRIPSETQAGVVPEIESAFDERIRPWAEDIQSRLSTCLARQSQYSKETYSRLDETCLKLSDLMKDNKKSVAGIPREFTSLNVKVDTVLHALQHLVNTHELTSQRQGGVSSSIQKSTSCNSEFALPVPLSPYRLKYCTAPQYGDTVLDKNASTEEELSRAVKSLFYHLQILIREYLFVTVAFLAICYRKIIQPFVSRSISRPLLASLDNGIIFEDALGRSSMLSCEYLHSWEMFTGVLQLWFRGLPGERNVRAGMFYILNSTRGSSTITPSSWCKAITHGIRLQMYVMVESESLEDDPSECNGSKDHIRSMGVSSSPVECLFNIMEHPRAINVAERPVTMGRNRDLIGNSKAEISAFRRVHLLI